MPQAEHFPYPVKVFVGDLNDDGEPDFESEVAVVQIRCGCTEDLRHDYGHQDHEPGWSAEKEEKTWN